MKSRYLTATEWFVNNERRTTESTGGVASGYVENGFEERAKLQFGSMSPEQNGQNDRSPRPQRAKDRGVPLRYVERFERSEYDGDVRFHRSAQKKAMLA